MFEPGQIVGEYQVVRQLGRGGLGAVYEAVHRISRRAEAMKVLLTEGDGPEGEARFIQEIQLLASLHHPHIAQLHNAFHFGSQIIMMMELVQGEDLHSPSRRSRLALPDLINLSLQVLSALEYAHGHGVVHRDIKPANIMVTIESGAKLLDFGIATTQRGAHLTATGFLVGSPTYMSPEQIRSEPATPQSDIYSMAVSLYELIAG